MIPPPVLPPQAACPGGGHPFAGVWKSAVMNQHSYGSSQCRLEGQVVG